MFRAFNGRKIIKTVAVLLILSVLLIVGWLAFSTFYPLKHVDLIIRHANENDLSPAFVAAVIRAESRFRETAVSHRGAKGLMQIMDSTGEWLAGEIGIVGFETEHVFDPEINIQIGSFYLRRLLNQFGGDQTVALAAYNAGSGTVRGWLNDPRFSSDGKTLSYIPFPETRTYVERIERFVKVYEIYFRVIEFIR
ncbi:MAG: lytic transglycosylase domain-containing protein [Defluviitaleaceae bacterium]|nr:lytic transglycosylase domain-containing protein [Defluviitaleaceae bacterium]